MSDFSSNSEIPETKNGLSPTSPAALAEKLQDIARDLLEFHHTTSDSVEEYVRRNLMAGDAGKRLASEDGEVHCYYLCPFTARNVNTLLKEEGAGDWLDLLCNVHTSLRGFIILLENIDPEAELKGFVLHVLAQELTHIGNLLTRIHDAYGTSEKIDIFR